MNVYIWLVSALLALALPVMADGQSRLVDELTTINIITIVFSCVSLVGLLILGLVYCFCCYPQTRKERSSQHL